MITPGVANIMKHY